MDTNSSSQLRRAAPDDLDALEELETLLFPENNMSRRLLGAELGRGWCVVTGSPIYGYALIREDGPLLDITRLGVHPAHQGRGLGSQLLGVVLAAGRPTLLTVRKNNARAIRLYRRRHFDIIGDLGRSESWLMRWSP